MRVIASRVSLWIVLLSLGLAGQSWAFTFSSPIVVDDNQPASEPGLAVDSEGRIFIHAPVGLLGPSRIWRSTDGGNTFEHIAPANVNVDAPPSVVIGGGDADLAIDGDNNLYFVDLWLGNSSVAFSNDNGNTWTGHPLGSVPIQDRPWISADPTMEGAAFLVTGQIPVGLFLSKTLPILPGVIYPVTVPEITNVERGFFGFAPPGNLVTNRKGDTYNVYAIFTGEGEDGGIGVSKLPSGSLLPENSEVDPAHGADDQTQAFPIVAVDGGVDDNLYVVWTDPVSKDDWRIRFASFNGMSWSNAVTLGHGVFPWVTAQAPGKVDVAWYSAELSSGYIGDPNDNDANGKVWDVAFAQSLNALASTPSFSAPVQAATGAKTGKICTAGAACDEDRELADFLSIHHDGSGNALIAYTFVPAADQSLVRFVKQTGGSTIHQ